VRLVVLRVGVDGPLIAVDGRAEREAAKAFLQVAELGQHASVTAVARQRLLVKPPA